MPTKKSNLLPAVVAVGIVVGGAAAYWYFKGNFGSGASPLASAKVVPDEALMAAFISTDPRDLAQLQKFGTPEAEKLVEKSLQDFDRQVLTKSNINYEQDIKPWLGSVTIAVLPPGSAKQIQATPFSSQSNILLVLGIKNGLSAWNFSKKLKADKTVTSQEFDYKGQKITESTSQGEPIYSSILDSRVVLAPTKQAVEQAIDTYKGEPSFAAKAGIDRTFAQSLQLKNPIAQIYLPDYAAAVQQLTAANPAGLPPQTLAQLQSVKAVVAGVGVDDMGIRMKAIAQLNPHAINIQYQNSPSKVVTRFPVDTLALLTGAGISRTWAAFVDQTRDLPEVKQGLDSARRSLKTTYNLDLDRDVFGWMDGEFAIGAISSSQGMLASLGFGGVLMFQTSDRATAESTLGKLDAIARSNFLSVVPRDINGKSVTEWQVPAQGAIVGHGWLDRDTMFIAVGEPIVEAIANPSGKSLDSSEVFKAATGSLIQPNAGYFYLDMDKTMSLLASKPLSTAIDPEATAVINSIRGIGITASNPDKTTSQMELRIALKQRS
ncbi:MAG: hypothetical protein N4J56_002453 [Chroococcidiopsis sp. SAG 2025]|uniref:DUF3352 domain-containing protein n=1 Tax=Chroococcidiopsis sp. SAG 2025 TaxID=171389 RepID=UPI002936D776|nr:DUF3352 domain-containing protein [Chroococcidiopsis sp. SAG 2025]MDV2992799.1 hypothetical protein [Chroococcidiopsis sp. SAG 2025]